MRDYYERWQVENFQAGAGDGMRLDRVRVSYPAKLDFLQSQWIKVFEELGHASIRTGFAKSSAGAVTVTNAINASKGERSHAGAAF